MSKTQTTGSQKISQGAIRAAEIITRRKLGDSKRCNTEYGLKTVEGIAAIIDRHTAVPDLLAACEEAVAGLRARITDAGISREYRKTLTDTLKAAIAKATNQS